MHYTRQSNSQWASAEYIAESDTLRFAGLDVELPLAEIYRKITFGGQNG
jgi:hypothetical protein